MADALATYADVELRLGRTLTTDERKRVAALLTDASARFRREAGGQLISLGTSTLRARSCSGRLWLPQRPVTGVTTVVDDDAVEVDVEWTTPDPFIVITSADGFLTVTYDHGFELSAIPDEVVAVVAQMAGRAFGVPLDQSGVTQTTLGAFSQSFGSAAGQGGIGMLGDEKAIAHAYRPPRMPIPTL